MDRDEASKGGGYSANSYLAVLEEQIPKCYEPGRTFMQDNASIHTANRIKEYFKDNSISLLNWPPYSPDINPIEHVWSAMKEWITSNHPELANMGKSQAAYDQLAHTIVEAWEAMPMEYINKLIRGIPRRVETLRIAKGWHTKY
jgi:DDE superfamily endonuclease